MPDKIAITLDANSDAIIVPRADAIATRNFYYAHTLVHEVDIKLNNALIMALGPVEVKPRLTVNDGALSTAERKLREWTGGK